MQELTYKELLRILMYEPDEGKFYWLVRTNSRAAAGSEAGCPNGTGKGYNAIRIAGKLYRRAHLAFFYMTGRWPRQGMQIDHINRIRDDDRWINLREVTPQENRHNTPCTGVSFDENNGSYRAQIQRGNETRHKRCDSFEEARAVRRKWEDEFTT